MHESTHYKYGNRVQHLGIKRDKSQRLIWVSVFKEKKILNGLNSLYLLKENKRRNWTLDQEILRGCSELSMKCPLITQAKLGIQL